MYKLNDKIKNLTPYPAVTEGCAVRLDANESFIDLPQNLKERVAGEMEKLAFNRYPDPYARCACEAFAAYYGIDARFVTAGNGSDELLSVLAGAFFQKGDRVLTLAPDFSMYDFYCRIYELEAVRLQKDDRLTVSPEEVIAAAKGGGVRGVLFSNPCNPTAAAMPAAGVRKIIAALPDTLIVLDEAYMDFYGDSLIREASGLGNVILLRTCSKNFGLAAIRVGFAVANEALTDALRAVKSPYNVNALSAAAAAVILREKAYLTECLSQILLQRDKLQAGLRNLPGIRVFAGSTNFVFIDCKNAGGLQRELYERGVAVRYTAGMLRVTAGSDSENEAFLKEFKAIYENG